MKSLYYQNLGDSTLKERLVVLCHGLFGQSDNLMPLARQLATDYWVVVPDLINHGRSPHRKTMSFRAMAQDIADLMDEIGVSQAVFLGHSLGGKVVLQFASLFPGKVKGLVIADIAPVDYPPHHAGIVNAMLEVHRQLITTRKQAQEILSDAVDDQALVPFFMKSLEKGDDNHWHWRIGIEEIAAAYDDLRKAPELVEQISQPVLFIKGENSAYIQASHQQAIEAYCADVHLKVIQGAGHWLHAEKPKAFNQLVEQFIKKLLE